MSIPNLPTDNLYKFVALCGLVMVVAAQWYAWTDSDKTFEEYFELSMVMDDARLEITDARTEFKAELHRFDSKLEQINEDIKNIADGKTVDAVIDGDDLIIDDKNISRDLAVSMNKYMRALEMQIQLIDRQNRVNKGRKRMVYGGVVLMALGFGLWYYKCQRHLDKIVLIQAKENKP